MAIALVQPTTLIGAELRSALGDRSGDRDFVLVSDREDEIGTVLDAFGKADFVKRLDEDSLEGVDLVVSCGASRATREKILSSSGERTVLHVDVGNELEEDDLPEVTPLVRGVHLDEELVRHPQLLSPHPIVVGVSQLVAPLRALGLEHVSVTATLPVSTLGAEAIDGLFNQTREVLSMTAPTEQPSFETQAAFNVYRSGAPAAALGRLTERTLGLDAGRAQLQVLRAGVFHGATLSAFCRTASPATPAAVRDALQDSGLVEVAPAGVVSAVASGEHAQIIADEPSPATDDPCAFWLFAALDNLTVAGASNVVAILDTFSGRA